MSTRPSENVGGRPGVVAAHGIDLSDGSLDIDGGEGPERRLGGCLLLQTVTSPRSPSNDASVGVLYVLWLSLPYLSSSRGGRRLELLKWGWVAKVSIEKDGSRERRGWRTFVSSRHAERQLVTPRPRD